MPHEEDAYSTQVTGVYVIRQDGSLPEADAILRVNFEPATPLSGLFEERSFLAFSRGIWKLRKPLPEILGALGGRSGLGRSNESSSCCYCFCKRQVKL